VSVVETYWSISHNSEFEVSNFEVPAARSNVEAGGHRRQLHYTVKRMMFIVVKHCHKFSKESVDIFFSIQVLPVFQPESWKFLEQLSFLEEIHFLGLLVVPLCILLDEFKQQILSDLVQGLSHEHFAFEARVHR